MRKALEKLAGYSGGTEEEEEERKRSVTDEGEEEEEAEALGELEEEGGTYRDIKGEVAGNIHKLEFRNFWDTVLKPDKYVQNIINEGYKLPFKGDKPGQYEEPNNKSCLLYTSPSPRDRQKSRMPSSA